MEESKERDGEVREKGRNTGSRWDNIHPERGGKKKKKLNTIVEV